MKYILICLAVAGMLVVESAHAQGNDESLIRELSVAWVEATNGEELEGLLELLSDDVIIFSPGAEPIRGLDAVKEIYGPYYEAYDLDISSTMQEVEISGNLAYVWSLVEGTRGPREAEDRESFTYHNLWVFKKADTGWKFWRLMFNSPAS